jgi:cellobiose-specific phosphotransferase system component IIC
VASRDRDRPVRRIIRWLTALSIVAGLFSTLIYASGAHLVIRYLNPEFGAWWDAHQFAIMEASATVLGLLIAIRCASRLVEDNDTRRRAKIFSLVISAIIVMPLSHAVASLARLGWDGHSARIRNFLQAIAGYDVGNILDKIVMGGVYFVKSCAFAVLAGLALYAIVMVILMSFEKSDSVTEQREAPVP